MKKKNHLMEWLHISRLKLFNLHGRKVWKSPLILRFLPLFFFPLQIIEVFRQLRNIFVLEMEFLDMLIFTSKTHTKLSRSEAQNFLQIFQSKKKKISSNNKITFYNHGGDTTWCLYFLRCLTNNYWQCAVLLARNTDFTIGTQ